VHPYRKLLLLTVLFAADSVIAVLYSWRCAPCAAPPSLSSAPPPLYTNQKNDDPLIPVHIFLFAMDSSASFTTAGSHFVEANAVGASVLYRQKVKSKRQKEKKTH
jgi:hypothetical protein